MACGISIPSCGRTSLLVFCVVVFVTLLMELAQPELRFFGGQPPPKYLDIDSCALRELILNERNLEQDNKLLHQTLNSYYFERTNFTASEPVTVMIWHPTRQTGAKKLHNLYPEPYWEEANLVARMDIGGCENWAPGQQAPERKCKDVIFSPEKFTYCKKELSNAHVVVFQPDILAGEKIAPFKPAHQLWAVFGHEPTWKTAERDSMKRGGAYRDVRRTAIYDISYHWGRNADVPLNFFYLDKFYFGEDPGKWWKYRNNPWNIDPATGQLTVENDNIVHSERGIWWLKRLYDGSALESAQDLSGDQITESNSKYALVSIMVRRCAAPRRQFISLFMSKCASVSYGDCHRNSQPTEKGGRTNGKKDDLMMEKVKEIAKHPFHLAIESEKEAGFVSEKLFQSLYAGTVPIYFGSSEDAYRMAPKNSFIDGSSFGSVSELVNYIYYLSGNFTAYMEYHAWRLDPETDKIFERLTSQGRTTAPCRLCEYYANLAAENHRDKGRTFKRIKMDTRPAYHPERGWERKEVFSPKETVDPITTIDSVRVVEKISRLPVFDHFWNESLPCKRAPRDYFVWYPGMTSYVSPGNE